MVFLYGDRFLPFQPSYWNYSINRAILPEDNTFAGFMGMRRKHDPYSLIYYKFKVGNEYKIILNTNIPASEREQLKSFENYNQKHLKNCTYASLIPTLFFCSFLNKRFNLGYLYVVGFLTYGLYSRALLKSRFHEYTTDYLSYFYNKYADLAVDSFDKVNDKRRNFFKPDTSHYYRETPQEIYDSKNADQLHDGSIYYGPHPFNDHENIDDLLELNKKFLDGHSKYDDMNEHLLGEPIDIKRKIRDIPTSQDFKNIKYKVPEI